MMHPIPQRLLLTLVALLLMQPGAVIWADGTPRGLSPKDVAAAFGQAIKDRDIAAAKALTVGAPMDEKIIDTFAAASAARAKLHDAAVKKFAKDELTPIPPSPGRGPVGAERLIDMSQWEGQIDGETATLTSRAEPSSGPAAPPGRPGATGPTRLYLKKIDGKWKLDISSMVPTDRQELYFAVLQTTSRISGEVADDILAGKYKTSDDARADYRRRMLSAVRSQMAPSATRPKPTSP